MAVCVIASMYLLKGYIHLNPRHWTTLGGSGGLSDWEKSMICFGVFRVYSKYARLWTASLSLESQSHDYRYDVWDMRVISRYDTWTCNVYQFVPTQTVERGCQSLRIPLDQTHQTRQHTILGPKLLANPPTPGYLGALESCRKSTSKLTSIVWHFLAHKSAGSP